MTARATAACAGPNICTACLAPLMVTLLKSSVSGLHARFGVTTARRVVKPSELRDRAWVKAAPACPLLEPMMRSICAISLPSPTSDSPMKKSAAMESLRLRLVEPRESRNCLQHEVQQTGEQLTACSRPGAVPPQRV